MISRIYLDYQATTPADPRVVAAMRPYLEEAYGNPHSGHAFGWEAAQAVDEAAAHVAALIGADPGEIVFTSGATEANNFALQGIARTAKGRGNHIITSAIEHKCVLNTALWLRDQGFELDVIPVSPDGLMDLGILGAAMEPLADGAIGLVHQPKPGELDGMMPDDGVASLADPLVALS